MATPGNTNRSSLALNLVVIVGSVLAVNGLIFGLGWADEPSPRRATLLSPPGWVIGAVWVVLFVFLAVARWRLGTADERRWVTSLILFCLAYPLYTAGFDNLTVGFLGNLATIALAGYVTWRSWPVSRLATACVLPVVLWVIYATFIVMKSLGWISSQAA